MSLLLEEGISYAFASKGELANISPQGNSSMYKFLIYPVRNLISSGLETGRKFAEHRTSEIVKELN